MPSAYRCPQCGTQVPGDAPQGLCPNCVLKAGFGTQVSECGSQAWSESASTGAFDARFVPPAPAELAPHFPDLDILELLGQGGMGVVYKARQKKLDRLVALEILSPKIGQDPAFAERFQREAKAMAMLNHPHIVAVYDFGQTELRGEGREERGESGELDFSSLAAGGGKGDSPHLCEAPEGPFRQMGTVPFSASTLYYFFMEYVDGAHLRRLLDTGKLSPEEALAIVPQICDALQYAHDHGVVHRDIKPENVLLNKEGRVKIADFGLAKLMGTSESIRHTPCAEEESIKHAQGAEADGTRRVPDTNHVVDGTRSVPATVEPAANLTAAGQVMGTPQYMAPEQIAHPQSVDHRADIYSLGVVFYQMLTGELPVGRFAPPSKKVQIDVRLDEVVLLMLEREPNRRYQQVSEMKTRVESIATSPGLKESTGGRHAESRSPRTLHICSSIVTTPEELATFGGQFGLYYRKKQLLLNDRELTFSQGISTTVIPLESIRDLSLGHYPRAIHPVRIALISMIYDENGRSKQLFFSPYESRAGLPSRFNQCVVESYHSIRAAVKSATGREPGNTPANELGVPRSSLGLYALYLILLVPLVMSLVQLTTPRGWKSVVQLFQGHALETLVGGAVLVFFLLILYTRLQGRKSSTRSTGGGKNELSKRSRWLPSRLFLVPSALYVWFLMGGHNQLQVEVNSFERFWLGVAGFPLITGLGAMLAWMIHRVLSWREPVSSESTLPASRKWCWQTILASILLAISLPIGGGAMVIADLLYQDRHWNPSVPELGMTAILLGGTALLALATTLLGIEGLTRIRRSPDTLGGRAASWAAAWFWPIVLIVFGFCLAETHQQRRFSNENLVTSTSNIVQYPGGPWMTQLSEGSLELVAVSRHPSNGQPWWKPDGSPTLEGPFLNEGNKRQNEAPQRSSRADYQKGYEFVLRPHGLDHPSCPQWQFEVAGKTTRGFLLENASQILEKEYTLICAINMSDGFSRANLRLGVAVGPWNTLSTCDTNGTSSSSPDLNTGSWFPRPFETADGSVVANVVYTQETSQEQTRLVLIDKDGKEHVGNGIAQSTLQGYQQRQITFGNIRFDRVKEFRFQSRPYQWVEFRNVAIRPHSNTNPAASTPPTPNQLELEKAKLGRETAKGELASLQKLADEKAQTPIPSENVKPVTPLSETQPTVPEETKPAFAARLPNGVTVELFGIAEVSNVSGSSFQQMAAWWRPDGSPLADRPCKGWGLPIVIGKDEKAREMAFYLHDMPTGPVDIQWRFDPSLPGGVVPDVAAMAKWWFPKLKRSSVGNGHGKDKRDLRSIPFLVLADQKTVNVRVGLAVGVWQTVCECTSQGGTFSVGDQNVLFLPALEKDGNVMMRAIHNIAGCQVQLLALDTNGYKLLASSLERGKAGEGKEAQVLATFTKHSLKELKAFRLQKRPYEWCEFRNVSLESGHATIVKVAPETLPAGNLAPGWVKKVFDHFSHNFGIVTQGTKLEHVFSIENVYAEDVHIRSVESSSSACFSPKLGKDTLKSFEKTELTVTMDTAKFVGNHSATIKVVFDKPFPVEILLPVAGRSEGDMPSQGDETVTDLPRALKKGPTDPLHSPRAAEMRSILLAGIGYAIEHPGWPASLDELSPMYLDASKADLSQFIYRPLSEESLWKNPKEVPVLFEKKPAFDGGQLVGWADGYVEFISDSTRLKQLFPEPTPAVPEPGRK